MRRHLPPPLRRSMVLLALATGLFLGCSAGGVSTVADSEEFLGCLQRVNDPESGDNAAETLEDVDDWDEEREKEFWSSPDVLDCAVRRLTEAERRDAFAVVFPEQSDDNRSSEDEGPGRQRDLVATYAGWARDSSESEAVALLRVGDLLATIWVAEVDDSRETRSMAEVATLAVMRAQGDLPGFEPWLAGQPDGEDNAEWLLRYTNGSSFNKIEELGGDEERFSQYLQLSSALVDRVRR